MNLNILGLSLRQTGRLHFLSFTYLGHSIKQWYSSSIVSHNVHFLSFLITCLVLHLPCSMLNKWELNLMFVIATLCALFVMCRYDSNPKSSLIWINSLPVDVEDTFANQFCRYTSCNLCLKADKNCFTLPTCWLYQYIPIPAFNKRSRTRLAQFVTFKSSFEIERSSLYTSLGSFREVSVFPISFVQYFITRTCLSIKRGKSQVHRIRNRLGC